MRLALGLALLALVLPVVAGAQGLGGAAARERQKRRQQGPAGAPVFRNNDLSTGKGGTGEPTAGAETAAAAEPGTEVAHPDPAPPATKPAAPPKPGPAEPLERERHERTLLQAEWRVRFANAREQLARAEAASWRDVVRTELQAGVPVPMRIKEQIETPELKQARQALVELEEAYRKTGLPPGWVRQP